VYTVYCIGYLLEPCEPFCYGSINSSEIVNCLGYRVYGLGYRV
jgi:hypothetical protein